MPRPSAAEIAFIARLYGREPQAVREQIESADPDADDNLAGMCRTCHDRKTRVEQRRFEGGAG